MDVKFIDPVTVLLNARQEKNAKYVADKRGPWEWWNAIKMFFNIWE